MARIRTIKPEFCVSEQLSECSVQSRLVFALMWLFCDDQGIHPAKPKTLRGEIFPLDDSITTAQVEAWTSELLTARLLREYEVGGERFWIVTGWLRHQKIDKPSRKYPPPPPEDSSNIRQALPEPSPKPPRPLAESSPPEGNGVEGNGDTQPPKKRDTGGRDIPAAPAPSRAVLPSEFPKSDDARVIALHGLCLASRVRASILDARQWVADGITEEVLTAAIHRGHDRKSGEALNVGFLQCMVRDVLTGAAPSSIDPAEVVRRAAARIAAKEAGNATH